MSVVVIEKRPVVDVMLDYLRAERVQHVFGIPGGLLIPFFSEVELSADIDLIVTKHEQGAVFMADGYAHARGGIAVCAGTAGPGSTNMLTGVAVAYSRCTPMLVLTGQVPSHLLGRGASQETTREDIDIVGMFRPVTKYSAMVPSPDRFVHHLRRGLRLAMTGRRGPVHLNVPVNFWRTSVPITEAIDAARYRPPSRYFDRDAVKHVADLLVDARRPVIVAGAGVAVSGARRELRLLAERIGARVVTTPTAKGVFPEDHPLSFGVVGLAGHAAARDLVLESGVDVLMCVGTSLNERATYNWDERVRPSGALIQVDIDPDRLGNSFPIDIPVVGDAKTVMKELIFHIERSMAKSTLGADWVATTPVLEDRSSFLEPELRASDAVPLTPQRWRCDLMEVLPTDAVIYSDIGGHMLFNIHHLRIGRDQEFHINLSFASMGHGTVAPIGARISDDTRPVFAIVGDACFTMNGMELLVAVEHEVPVIWIVENNQMHGVTWHATKKASGAPLKGIRYRTPLQVAAIAEAMGLEVYVVDRPGQIQQAVTAALASGRPSLIDVQVDPTIGPPLEDRAELIGGFEGE